MKTRDFINQNDLFATPVYGFNIAGNEKIGSFVGCIGTILVLTTTLLYGTIKMGHLIRGKNPAVAYFEEFNMFETENETIDVSKTNLSLAFQVRDIETDTPRDDPRFVKWIA